MLAVEGICQRPPPAARSNWRAMTPLICSRLPPSRLRWPRPQGQTSLPNECPRAASWMQVVRWTSVHCAARPDHKGPLSALGQLGRGQLSVRAWGQTGGHLYVRALDQLGRGQFLKPQSVRAFQLGQLGGGHWLKPQLLPRQLTLRLVQADLPMAQLRVLATTTISGLTIATVVPGPMACVLLSKKSGWRCPSSVRHYGFGDCT